jgi:YfiH family protein
VSLTCHYERKQTFIEASFAAADGTNATESPRIIVSTLAAGDLRFKSDEINPMRHDFLEQFGLNEERILALELVHSRNVLLVQNRVDALSLQARAKSIGGADGILSTDPEFIPSVTVADCMPIWLSVKGTRITGVLHSGWKGTGILAAAVHILQAELGIQPQQVSAVLGPAIGKCCYSVDEARARSFADEFGEKSVARTEGQSYLDLRAANEGIAESLGLGSLESMDICTFCDKTLGSSRRQGQKSFTRMMAMCGYF